MKRNKKRNKDKKLNIFILILSYIILILIPIAAFYYFLLGVTKNARKEDMPFYYTSIFVLLAYILIGVYFGVKYIYFDDANDIVESELENKEDDIVYLKVNDKVLEIVLEKNSSANAFMKKLDNSNIIVNASDYSNFEKVGDLGFDLPTNDSKISVDYGDVILYQGNKICIYYDTNEWSFTKIGHIKNVTKTELEKILGDGDVTLEFSLNNNYE